MTPSRHTLVNLKNLLNTYTSTRIYLQDEKGERLLPCIVLGYDSETDESGHGQYQADAWALVEYQGKNTAGDETAIVSATLKDPATINYLCFNPDRPAPLSFVQGITDVAVESAIDGDSFVSRISFHLFNVAFDATA